MAILHAELLVCAQITGATLAGVPGQNKTVSDACRHRWHKAVSSCNHAFLVKDNAA